MPYLSKLLVPKELVEKDETLQRAMRRAEKGDLDAVISIAFRLRDHHGVKALPLVREST
jgi:hypothetical protein